MNKLSETCGDYKIKTELSSGEPVPAKKLIKQEYKPETPEDINCDICGKKLSGKTKNGYQYQVGLMLDVEGGFEKEEFTALFGKTRLTACYCCFAKSVGFKVIEPGK